jgi:N-acetylmuramoyl-L-alanine amidase
VDAGHGGHDPGALSPFSPLTEKQLTLDIALRLRRLLEQAGYRVQMTRETDVYLSLADRVALANRLQADAFVSVHLNSFPRPGERSGTEVYYWTPQSLPLAEAIYRNLLALLGRKGNGVRRRRFYVIHHTTMPSVLVEACYLNHPEEEQLLRDENFRQKIALAIFRGIAEFFGDQRILQRAPKEATGE